jgi:DHA3 family macrolide efflux protein-like MFS transporter
MCCLFIASFFADVAQLVEQRFRKARVGGSIPLIGSINKTRPTMSKFRNILRNRNFFLLWIGQIISQLGDRLDQMALIGFIHLRAPGSTFEIAKILSFTILPVFIIGPIAGVYVDRWDRRRTMYIADFLRALLVLTIPVFLFYSKNLGWIYLIIFVMFSVGRFFVPAKLSIIPELVQEKDLLMANSLINTTGMIAAIIGFGASGLIIEWFGARSGFYLDALSFLVSATCIFLIAKKLSAPTTLKKVGREIVEVIRTSVFVEIKEGWLYFINNKKIRATAWIIFILWSALGAVYVVLIVFVQKTLHSATKDLGLLIMFLGIGLFLGSLLYGRFGQKIEHFKIIFASLVLSGIMLIVFAAGIYYYPTFLFAAALALALGMTIAPIMIASNTIIHNASENHMMGKIFSSLEVLMHLAFLLFMFLCSILAERLSHLAILVGVGILISLLGLACLIWYRKEPWLCASESCSYKK